MLGTTTGMGITAPGKSIRNRRGRKRKQGKRSAVTGRLLIPAPDGKAMIALQPHRRDLPEGLRGDPLAESAMGQLKLKGVISDEQHEAGRLFAVAVGRYLAVIKAPKAIGGTGKGYGCPLGGCGDGSEDCGCQRRRDTYRSAYDALAGAGRASVMAVNVVAVEGRACLLAEIADLRAGLTVLEQHYGLRSRGRGRIVAGGH